MVVVASYGPAGNVTLNLDRKALGLADNLTAVNVQSNERLERLSPGQFKLTIPRHDFRIVRLEQAAQNLNREANTPGDKSDKGEGTKGTKGSGVFDIDNGGDR